LRKFGVGWFLAEVALGLPDTANGSTVGMLSVVVGVILLFTVNKLYAFSTKLRAPRSKVSEVVSRYNLRNTPIRKMRAAL
jgi:hypothetical protein